MAEPDLETPLYDVEESLRILARQRRRRDQLTMAQIEIADRLANHLKAHFGPEATETAGLALVLGAASVLTLKDCQPAILINVLAFAGQRLVVDSRAADESVTGAGEGWEVRDGA